jgi:hypothetical protein
MAGGGRLIQVGDIVFRDALLYVQADGENWKLERNTGFLRLAVSRKEYRALLKTLFHDKQTLLLK